MYKLRHKDRSHNIFNKDEKKVIIFLIYDLYKLNTKNYVQVVHAFSFYNNNFVVCFSLT